MMRKMFQKNDGYTLLELLATLVTGSIVTLAAVTILFLGVRINRQSMDTASRQTTTRILLSSLEDLATEGTITRVASDLDSWKVYGEGNTILYAYDSKSQTICAGGADDDKGTTDVNEAVAGKPIMEGVISSDVTLDGQLLTVSVETEDGTYSSSVYCRMAVNDTDDKSEQNSDKEIGAILNPGTVTGGTEKERRIRFLQILASQYAITTDAGVQVKNPGMILTEKTGNPGVYIPATTGPQYFSQWYIVSTGGNWGQNGWNADTPWCACFVSWGLNQVLGNGAPCYANVDSFMNYLKKSYQWEEAAYYHGTYNPNGGDLIFFDWKINGIRDPEHVGAVIKVATEKVDEQDVSFVYTIEGNSSNRVAIRKYKIDDPRIIGYGVLKWTGV